MFRELRFISLQHGLGSKFLGCLRLLIFSLFRPLVRVYHNIRKFRCAAVAFPKDVKHEWARSVNSKVLWDKLFLHPFSGLVAMATLPLKNRQQDFGSNSMFRFAMSWISLWIRKWLDNGERGNHSKFGCSQGAGQARPHQKKALIIIATSVRLSGPILNYMSYLGCYKPLTNWDAWSMSQSVCLAACLPVWLSVRPSVWLSVSLSLAFSRFLSLSLSLWLSVLSSSYPSVHPSIHPFISSSLSVPLFLSTPLVRLHVPISICSYPCLPVYPRLFRRTPHVIPLGPVQSYSFLGIWA